ncbi:hypothetical protein ACLVWQ_14020 [Streptomyces sp. CWNU-52B]|uniref:hypothetical protein n=1 Tax=unclassified Streptomyces TaxID=2593676 RepID=UPI0039C37B65
MTGTAGEEGHIRPERGTDGMGRAWLAAGTGGAAAPPPSGAPVFVDPSGRRAGRMRRMGWLVVAGCVCSAATLGVAVTGGDSTAPWLHLPAVLGGDSQNRSADEALRPERQEPGARAADRPSATAAGSPVRKRADALAAEPEAGRGRGDGGASASPGGPGDGSPSAPTNTTNDTGSRPADDSGAVAGQPSPPASPGAGEEPTTEPSPATPASPAPSAEPSPAGTSAPGLLDGLVDAVSGLFGT